MGIFGTLFRTTTEKPRKRASRSQPKEASGHAGESAVTLEPASFECLMQLVPCNQMDSSELKLLQSKCRSRLYGPGDVLFNRGPSDGSAWYLLEGEVTLDLGEQKRTVSAKSGKVSYPFAYGHFYEAVATASTEAKVLPIPESLMIAALQKKRARSISASALDMEFSQLPDVLRESEVFYTFWRTYQAEALDFPVLPQVALRLRAAMQKDIGVEEAARIVQTDPVITARLIEIANSPLYIGAAPVTSCQQAINRIGLHGTRNLVTSLTLGQMFTCQKPRLQRRIQQLWQDSVRISCLSYVLARGLAGMDPEQALLAGLMAHIGALPFLYFATDFPTESLSNAALNAAVDLVKGPLGAQLLEAWEFPDELRRIPMFCEDWFYTDEGELSLTDVVILANWHARLGKCPTGSLPPIETMPAYQKLDLRRISPDFSLDLLHNASQQINQVRLFFNQ